MGTQIRPFINRLYIVDKDAKLSRLGDVMSPAQDRLLTSVQESLDRRQPVRKRILKARQMGFSTMVEAIMFTIAMVVPYTKGLVVSHDQDSAEHLLTMTHTYWDEFFGRAAYTQKSSARNRMGWDETKSLLTITTAKTSGSARSRTLHFVHGSEVAFWQNPERLLTGLNQALPRSNPLTFFFQESTANGVGNWWHRACNASMEGEDEYDFLFFGWWEHPEYAASMIGRADLLDAPFVYIDDEERTLYKYLKARGFQDWVIIDKLHWRRLVIATECLGDIDKFHQEYPTTPEEAFVSTGRNIFPIEWLRAAYKPMFPDTGSIIPDPRAGYRFLRDPETVMKPGPLSIYKYPDTSGTSSYVIGGDAGWTAGGDYACAQVINRDTWEQVATWREKTDANTFGEVMVLLGRMYGNALLVPEANRAGGATIGAIRARNYSNIFIHTKEASWRGTPDGLYGWQTNEQTKQIAISNMQKAFYDAGQPANAERGLGIRIHDQHTYRELKEYVKIDGKGGFGNSDGTDHDDTVMALGIGLSAIMHEAGMGLGGGRSEPAYNRLRVKGPEVAAMEERLGELGVAEGGVVGVDGGYTPAGRSDWLDDGGGDMFGANAWDEE
jgi:hypothetical protein